MQIDIFASGSKGNSYQISDGKTLLLLEAGIPFKELQKKQGYRMGEEAGVLISHEHLDHSRAVRDVLKRGMNVYMSRGTKEVLGLENRAVVEIKAKGQFTIGTFTILPFETEHDAKEPLGFLLQSKATGEKLLFATDTYFIRYKFKGLTHVMIECNYAKDILDRNCEEKNVPSPLRQRLLESHFSLENVKNFHKASDLSQLKETYLIHLSDSNSDAARFKKEIQAITGTPVYVV
jgi:phosphoribosyl 1,2-cyclic phosphodiesterase